MTARRDSGIALLLAMIAMTIVGGAAYRLLLHTDAHREITRSFANSLARQQRIRERIDSAPTPQRGCRTQRISDTEQRTQDWLTCSKGMAPFVTTHQISFPGGRVDYNTLFHSPSPCPGTLRSSAEGPQSPTYTSPFSGLTCELPKQIAQSLTSHANIRSDGLSIRPLESNQPITIASVGSIVIHGVLSLAGPTLIVAGGDIRIESVHATGLELIPVTILSAHGEILVGGASGALSIVGLSRKLLSVPQTSPPPATILLPPFVSGAIAGMKLL